MSLPGRRHSLAKAINSAPAPQAGSLTDTHPFSSIFFLRSSPYVMADIALHTLYGVKNCPFHWFPRSRDINRSPRKSWSGFRSSSSVTSANICANASISSREYFRARLMYCFSRSSLYGPPRALEIPMADIMMKSCQTSHLEYRLLRPSNSLTMFFWASPRTRATAFFIPPPPARAPAETEQ